MVADDDPAGSRRRSERAAEANERADEARERADQARRRLAELRGDDGQPVRGSTAAQADRAEHLAERSRVLSRRSAENAAAAMNASADVHESAAVLDDNMADLGLGDVAGHREQAERHRQQADADRLEAQKDEQLAGEVDSERDTG